MNINIKYEYVSRRVRDHSLCKGVNDSWHVLIFTGTLFNVSCQTAFHSMITQKKASEKLKSERRDHKGEREGENVKKKEKRERKGRKRDVGREGRISSRGGRKNAEKHLQVCWSLKYKSTFYFWGSRNLRKKLLE